jgi:uncharacterized protein (DUF924 family)
MTNRDKDLPQQIVSFWFDDVVANPGAMPSRRKLWYGNNGDIDRQIIRDYAGIHKAANQEKLENWQHDAIGSLALVILLDQFSRNMYRGLPDAFASDELARSITRSATTLGQDKELPGIYRVFLYHPYHHAECLQDQNELVRLYRGLEKEASPEWKVIYQGFLKYGVEHRDVIARFGRFPHRNRILGRSSTAEEIEYLAGGASSYGQ